MLCSLIPSWGSFSAKEPYIRAACRLAHAKDKIISNALRLYYYLINVVNTTFLSVSTFHKLHCAPLRGSFWAPLMTQGPTPLTWFSPHWQPWICCTDLSVEHHLWLIFTLLCAIAVIMKTFTNSSGHCLSVVSHQLCAGTFTRSWLMTFLPSVCKDM